MIGVGIFMIAMISLGFNRGLVKMAFSLVSVFAVIICNHICLKISSNIRVINSFISCCV